MLPVFVTLFAVAILFDKALLGDRWIGSPHLAVCLAALWALLVPASLGRFVTLVAVYLTAWCVDMPQVSNHVMLTGLVLVVFAAWVGVSIVRGGGRVPDAPSLWAHLAPLLRGCVVLLYVFAAVAKLNRGFFEPQLSCATAMYGRLGLLPFLPRAGWTAHAAIWGTILVELGLPLLLLLPRTRLAGVVLAIPFHGVLAVSGHVPFSAYALMMLAAFLPEDMAERLQRCREHSPRLNRFSDRIARLAGRSWTFPAAALAWLLTVARPTSAWIPPSAGEFDEGLLLPFGLYLGAVSALLAWALALAPRRYRFGGFRLPHPILVLGPILVVANGLQPYLGLKTGGSFTMYSNIQTEGERWNHLLVPHSVKLFSLQDDLVRVIDSSDPRLRDTARAGSSWVYLQFQRYLRRHPEVAVTYERNGVRREVTRAADDAELGRGLNPVLAKLLYFRDVDPPGRAVCRR
jgi:hypothetical protein